MTSHASQGATVDKLFIGMGSQSFPATNQRTAYVAVTRGREQVQIFTDDRTELLKAMSRPDDPMSATQLAESTNGKAGSHNRLMKSLGLARQQAAMVAQNHVNQRGNGRHSPDKGLDHDR